MPRNEKPRTFAVGKDLRKKMGFLYGIKAGFYMEKAIEQNSGKAGI